MMLQGESTGACPFELGVHLDGPELRIQDTL
jgi:hypothetical protein